MCRSPLARTLLTLALCGAAGPLDAQEPPVLVIQNVSVVPMDTETVLANQMVVVRGGSIESVGPASGSLPPGATVIDAAGGFLIPGLAEMHAHMGAAANNPRILTLFALNGVTTARGMLTQPAHLEMRDSLARGLTFGPRMITAGPWFGDNVTPEQAHERVREQHALGYDLLKIRPGVTRAAFDALTETAHELGIPFAGHVPLDVGLDRAIAAGYLTIEHLDGILEALVPADSPITPAEGGWFGLDLVPYVDPAGMPEIAARMREAGIAIVPTLTYQENYANQMTGDELAARPEFRYWLPNQVDSWRDQKNARLADPQTLSPEQRTRYIELRRQLLLTLHGAGVPILLGADAPREWNVPGFSTHRELHLYVAAGLTPYQALRSGTIEIARHLGEEGRSGVVRPGAHADLILLEANPLEDIENTMRIIGVVLNGRWIGGAERERMLEALRTN